MPGWLRPAAVGAEAPSAARKETNNMRMTTIEEDEQIQNFAKKAATFFAQDKNLYSFSESSIQKGCLFALRFGLSDDCVLVFRLDNNFEPINFQQLIVKNKKS